MEYAFFFRNPPCIGIFQRTRKPPVFSPSGSIKYIQEAEAGRYCGSLVSWIVMERLVDDHICLTQVVFFRCLPESLTR